MRGKRNQKKVDQKTRVKRKYTRRTPAGVIATETSDARQAEEDAMLERIKGRLAGHVGRIFAEYNGDQKRVSMTGVAAAAAHHAVFSDLRSRLDAFATDPKAVSFILSPGARSAINKALTEAQETIENGGHD